MVQHAWLETVQNGDLYRLTPPADTNFKAAQYVSPDKSQSVVFAFLHSGQFGRALPALRLEGLEEKADYSVTVVDGKSRPGAKLPGKRSGAYLMHAGLELPLTGDYDATSVKLERVAD